MLKLAKVELAMNWNILAVLKVAVTDRGKEIKVIKHHNLQYSKLEKSTSVGTYTDIQDKLHQANPPHNCAATLFKR